MALVPPVGFFRLLRASGFPCCCALFLLLLGPSPGCGLGDEVEAGATWQPQTGPNFALQTTLRPFTWSGTASWVGEGLSAEPGGTWTIDYDLDVDLSQWEKRFGRFTDLVVAVQAWRLHDREGNWQPGMTTYAVTSRLSTTGAPVERFSGWPTLQLLHGRDGSPFEAVAEHPLVQPLASKHRVGGQLVVDLPEDTPEGWYEPRVLVAVRIDGQKDPIFLDNYGDNANTQDAQILPLVRVGSPADPHIPVALAGPRHYRGQLGTLPREDRQRYQLVGRAGYPRDFILPPGRHVLAPLFPHLFPERSIAPVDGGFDVVPEKVRSYLDPSTLRVRMIVDGDERAMVRGAGPEQFLAPTESDVPVGYLLDLTGTGKHTVEMTVEVEDLFGRTFRGGGAYEVWSALPLSFSTSVKPGTNYLVGESYPAKVNVNPSFPATIDVEVNWYPNSDPARHQRWTASGTANRFGHFFPYDIPPLRFEEPGEYSSRLRVSYTDARGRLWRGDQASVGVVAPLEPTIHLHGTRSPPHNIKVKEEWNGGLKRFDNRVDARAAFLPFKPGQVPDTFAPYHPEDTLYVQANGFKENIIEPHFSIAVEDPALSGRLIEGHRRGTILPSPTLQLAPGDWYYLEDVVQVSADSAAWFPAEAGQTDELPAASVGDGRWHPFNFPEGNSIDAYLTLGVVRPGFSVMTSIFETDAIGLYWLASPNRFGYNFGTGANGDLPGDFYRMQAGVVLKDHVTGTNHYDAHSSTISVLPDDGATTAILGPGTHPITSTSERGHRLFVGQDSHDVLLQGETIFLGGMVAPAVQTDVEWTVTRPDGGVVTVEGRSTRLGIVRGTSGVPADLPGVYRIRTHMTWGELIGDTVGTATGEFQHFVVPKEAESLLSSPLPAMQQIDVKEGWEIPLEWSEGLEDVEIHFGVIMPGRVLDQGFVEPAGSSYAYRFAPQQVAVQHRNYDARNYGTGEWEAADTVVLQFFLQASRAGEPVYDAMRFVLRGSTAYNYEALTDALVIPAGTDQSLDPSGRGAAGRYGP
ncbi:MAG: hypothetical protein VX498_03470 [Myxococcota bacterium]|nr:hypothetical protein [Myxococcota bacterium]